MYSVDGSLRNILDVIEKIEYAENSLVKLYEIKTNILHLLSSMQLTVQSSYHSELNDIEFTSLIESDNYARIRFNKAKIKLIQIINNLINEINIDSKPISIKRTSIFLVHGHKITMKERVARFLEKQNINTIILDEKANNGATIFEKLEQHSDVTVAVILISGDDKICGENKVFLRARQNVIFEYGFFCGRIGRKNIILLQDLETNIELPSDVNGVVSIEYLDNSESWKQKLGVELKSLNFDVSY